VKPSIVFSLLFVLLCELASLDSLWLSQVHAAPDLTALTPAYGQRGATLQVDAAGTFAVWPVRAWVNRSGITIAAGEKGKLTLTISPDATPGIYFIRLLDDTGASKPASFLVGNMPGFLEQEPNDAPQQPQVLELPAAVFGKLEKRGDVDCFAIQASQGELLVAKMMANPLFGTAMDGVLQICDQRGFVLQQVDDVIGMDPQIAVKIPRDGTYLVRAFAFPATPDSTIAFAGGADYRYLIKITTGPLIDFAFPLALPQSTAEIRPAETAGSQKAIDRAITLHGWNLPESAPPSLAAFGSDLAVYSKDFGGMFLIESTPDDVVCWSEAEAVARKLDFANTTVISGTIATRSEIDLFNFTGKKDEHVRIEIDGRKIGFDIDPKITINRIENDMNKQVAEQDDASQSEADPRIDFKVPLDGDYQLEVTDAVEGFGDRYRYRLRIEPIRPTYTLTIGQGEISVAANDKTFELEVNVNRLDGCKSAIGISATGLPDFVKCEKVISQPEGDSSQKVKLTFVIDGDHSFQDVIRISGVEEQQPDEAKHLVYAVFAAPAKTELDELLLTIQATAAAK
jgi:hypothetical protein